MHSMIIIILVSVLLLLEVLGLQMPFSILATGLAFGVLLIGLPHGGLDQKIGLRLLDGFRRPIALIIFFASYLLVAAFVVVGWFVSPKVTILAFFCLSAWHFGLEEETREHFSLVERLGSFARGGMVIWIPAFFQGDAVSSLLAMILPAGDLTVADQVVNAIQFSAPTLFALLVVDLVFSERTGQSTFIGLQKKALHRLRIGAFALLFATAHPLISFGVYFCTWHSVIGLVHLREQFRFSNFELALKLLPISLLAIALFFAGFVVSSSVNLFAPAIVQTIFIGLSAVAVPHLLLHVVSDSLRLNVQGVGS